MPRANILMRTSRGAPGIGVGASPPDAAELVAAVQESRRPSSRSWSSFSPDRPTGVGLIPNAYYWQGNQPDLFAAYLFNYAGRPDLTQKWVRRVLETKYGDRENGLDGNDDGGTLSAWYVLSSLGLFPDRGHRSLRDHRAPLGPRRDPVAGPSTDHPRGPRGPESSLYPEGLAERQAAGSALGRARRDRRGRDAPIRDGRRAAEGPLERFTVDRSGFCRVGDPPTIRIRFPMPGGWWVDHPLDKRGITTLKREPL